MLESVYNSRKFRMGLLAILVILAAGFACYLIPTFVQLYSSLVSGIVTIYGIYCGMNVANKYVLGKAQGATTQTAQLASDNALPQVQFPDSEDE